MSKSLGTAIDPVTGAFNIAIVEGVEGAGAKNGVGVSVSEKSGLHKTVLTLDAYSLTLTKNGTSSAGGGAKIYDFPAGLIKVIGATSNLDVSNAGGDGSFLMSLGSVAADTGGTLTGTEADITPSTAATVTSGVGTCKMKSSGTVPAAAPFDGTTTALDLILNAALNADATGKETLVINGTITVVWVNLGDN